LARLRAFCNVLLLRHNNLSSMNRPRRHARDCEF
jgi:hypothetical protein